MRMVEALALTIEAKDQTNHDHFAAREGFCIAVGKELKLNDSEMQALSVASLLHDIGKLAVPEYIIPSRANCPSKSLKGKFIPLSAPKSGASGISLPCRTDRARRTMKSGWLGISEGPARYRNPRLGRASCPQ